MGVLPGQKKLVVITRCFYKKMYGRFVGSKKTGRNNEVFL